MSELQPPVRHARGTRARAKRTGGPTERPRLVPVPGADAVEAASEAAPRIQLFDKCRGYTLAREVQKRGMYPYFRPISDSADTVVTIEGRERLMFGSNNYLGLTHHPKVLEAAAAALKRFGSGCTGSRFLNGTLDLHGELEGRLAAFLGQEDSLVFSTGYGANLGLIAGMIGRSDTVYLDKLDHASIVDGATLSRGTIVRYRHGDLADLERKMSNGESGGGKMIVVDGVYSMEGDISDIPRLLEVARRNGAALAVDEAHSLGILGPNGEGSVGQYGLLAEVDILTGTFSKSLASIGGFVAASEDVIHYLRHHSRPLIFTASLPPASAAGVLAALEIIQNEPERREAAWINRKRLYDGLHSLGFDMGESQTPILPVLIGPLETTLVFWRKLFDAGVFTNPVAPPAVAASACRLRTSVMATHTPEQIDVCLETFARVGRELGVIQR